MPIPGELRVTNDSERFYCMTMDTLIIELLYYRRLKILIDCRILSIDFVTIHLRYL